MRRAPLDHRGTTALVTGASWGLGAEFARKFAARGADLVLVARRRDRLEALADELTAAHRITVNVFTQDLTASDGVHGLLSDLETHGLAVDSLVNNAGFGITAPFAETDAHRLDEMLALNVVALTRLTRALLPQLLRADRGVLVNVASAAAYQPTPGMAAYGATKAYVLSLTEAIAEETRRSGLRVLALSPGPTSTEFFAVAGGDFSQPISFETPEKVVSVAFSALDHPQPRSVISGLSNRAMVAAAGLMPRRLALYAARRALE